MKFFLKGFLTGLVSLLIGICWIYLLLPKGLFFLWGVNKFFPLVASSVKETLFGAEFYGLKALIGEKEFKVKKLVLDKNYIYLPCKEGFAKVIYVPVNKLIVEVRSLKGKCIGYEGLEKVSGSLKLKYPLSVKGRLTISGFKYLGIKVSQIFLDFRGNYIILKIPSLGIVQKVILKEALKM